MYSQSRQTWRKLVPFYRSQLKREARRFLAKFARPQSCENPLKFVRTSLFFSWKLRTQLPIADQKIITLARCSCAFILPLSIDKSPFRCKIKFIAQLTTDSKFFHCTLANPCMMAAARVVCPPLPIAFRIANK